MDSFLFHIQCCSEALTAALQGVQTKGSTGHQECASFLATAVQSIIRDLKQLKDRMEKFHIALLRKNAHVAQYLKRMSKVVTIQQKKISDFSKSSDSSKLQRSIAINTDSSAIAHSDSLNVPGKKWATYISKLEDDNRALHESLNQCLHDKKLLDCLVQAQQISLSYFSRRKDKCVNNHGVNPQESRVITSAKYRHREQPSKQTLPHSEHLFIARNSPISFEDGTSVEEGLEQTECERELLSFSKPSFFPGPVVGHIPLISEATNSPGDQEIQMRGCDGASVGISCELDSVESESDYCCSNTDRKNSRQATKGHLLGEFCKSDAMETYEMEHFQFDLGGDEGITLLRDYSVTNSDDSFDMIKIYYDLSFNGNQ